jgi:hypothetical protein
VLHSAERSVWADLSPLCEKKHHLVQLFRKNMADALNGFWTKRRLGGIARI